MNIHTVLNEAVSAASSADHERGNHGTEQDTTYPVCYQLSVTVWPSNGQLPRVYVANITTDEYTARWCIGVVVNRLWDRQHRVVPVLADHNDILIGYDIVPRRHGAAYRVEVLQ